MNAAAFSIPVVSVTKEPLPQAEGPWGHSFLRPQFDLQKAEIQDGAVEVLSEICAIRRAMVAISFAFSSLRFAYKFRRSEGSSRG